MKENHSTVPLSAFFEALERRLARMTEPGRTSFQVKVCDQVIELRFLTEQDAKAATASLRGRVCRKACKPDAVFYYWADDCAKYVGEANRDKMLRSEEKGSFIFYNEYHGITAVDRASKAFYRCLPIRHMRPTTFFAHAQYELFYLWARTVNLFLIHAAAVGEDGRGVLIAGRGGSGKSTLSVGCMLAGMDFVADDYLLISGRGPLRAYPLYTSVYLNPDMAEILKPDLPVVFVNPNRGNRLGFDASEHPFCPQLTVEAIVAPIADDCNEPQIAPKAPGGAVTRMVYSTIQQMGVLRDPEPVRALTRRFMGIPVYEMRLSRDLQKNVKALRRFIREELPRVQAE